MTSSKKLSAVAALLGIAAAGYTVHVSHKAKAMDQNGPLACQFKVGEKLAFSVGSHSDVSASGGSAQQVGLSGVMWWRVLEEKAGGWVVGAAMSGVSLSSGGNVASGRDIADLESPFLLQIGKNCQFRELGFDPATPTKARQQLQGLLRSVEVILAPSAAAQWVSRHRDGVGVFEASYSRGGASPDGQGLVLNRQRGHYESTALPSLGSMGGQVAVEVLDSSARMVLPQDGRWVSEIEDREHLKVKLADKLLSEVSAVVNVRRVDEDGPLPASLSEIAMNKFAWGDAPVIARERTAAPAPLSPELQAADLDGALADFRGRLGQGAAAGAALNAARTLAGYLAAHPETIASLLDRIRSGAIDGKLHSTLFLALELTGTKQAEDALGGVLASSAYSSQNRARAAAALAGIANPTIHTAETLLAQTRMSGSGEEKDVANASLLALGSLSHRVQTRSPDVAKLTRETLTERLHTLRQADDLTATLDAVGNAGDKALAQAVEPYKTDESAAVRAHAARAYRHMDAATSQSGLADWLGTEPDAKVRLAISESLAESAHNDSQSLSKNVVDVAIARLGQETDPRARASLIRLIGTAVASEPAAKQALVEQFRREPIEELKVLIGRFLSAEDLS